MLLLKMRDVLIHISLLCCFLPGFHSYAKISVSSKTKLMKTGRIFSPLRRDKDEDTTRNIQPLSDIFHRRTQWIDTSRENIIVGRRSRTKRAVQPRNTVAVNFLNRSNRMIRIYETDYFGWLKPRFELRPNEPKAVWLVPGSYWTARDYPTGLSMLMNGSPWFLGRQRDVGKTIDLKIRAPKSLRRAVQNEATPPISKKYLKVMVIADTTVKNFYGKEHTEKYLATLVNMVARIYKDKSLGVPVNVIATRIHILEKDPESFKFTEDNPDGNVESACKYAESFWRRSGSYEKNFDFAVVLTRKNIGPSGYAAMYTMCTGESCALVKENGFASGFVIAHEAGHSLGIDHDGEDEECVEDKKRGSIMAPKVYSKHNRFHWSNCSRKALKENIRFFSCLNNPPSQVNAKFKEIQKKLAGETYSRDDQCKLYLGNQASHCGWVGQHGSCGSLYCRKFFWSFCSPVFWTAPLDGSLCQTGKWCIKGRCVRKEKPSPVNGNWGRWGSPSSCQGVCGAGVQYRTRKCNNPPPSDGGKNCTGKDYELIGCRLQECRGLEEKQKARKMHCERLGTGWRKLDTDMLKNHSLQSNIDCDFEKETFCGWRNDNQDDREWQLQSGPTFSRGTGPSIDHTTKSDRGKYIYYEASWVNQGDIARLISPRLLGHTFCLSFYYHMHGKESNMGSLHVYTLLRNNSAVEIWNRKGSSGDQWREARVTLESYESFEIIIEASRGRGYQSDIALDDITIKPGSCSTKGTSQPCKISCMAEDQQKVKSVVARDGTPCGSGDSLDVCFSGICEKIGCDYIYGSNTKKDKCGVCGGKGDTCDIVEGKKTVDTQKVMQEVITVPQGARQFVFTKRSQQISFLGLLLGDVNATNLFNTDGYRWSPGKYKALDTSFQYERSDKSESISSEGRVKGNFTVVVFTPIQRPENNINNQVEVSYRIKFDRFSGKHFAYVVTGYSSCSVPCGGGNKNPIFTCKEMNSNQVVGDIFCIGKRKPNYRPTRCNSQRCSYNWKTLGWDRCSSTCGLGYQTRSVMCSDDWGYPVQESNCKAPKPMKTRKCYQRPCPLHVLSPGPWGNCSQPCGNGIQKREIFCQNANNQSNNGAGSRDLAFRLSSLSNCAGEYPVSARLCVITNCSQYVWVAENFGGCSASCGGGVQIKILRCQDKTKKSVVPDRFCKNGGSGLKPPLLASCNTFSCDNNEWKTTKSNTVYCANKDTGRQVPDVLCKGTRPDKKQTISDISARLKELYELFGI